MFDALLLMAGSGKRTKLNYNKVLFKVKNKPLFIHSLEKFLSIEECKKIILVINKNDEEEILNYLRPYPKEKITLTYGGFERQDSVYAGIKCAESDYVLIHDAARPLITKDLILNIYENTVKYKAAIPSYQAIDTIKELKDGKLITLDRSKLYNIQTPQGVTKDLFIKVIELAKNENYYATDDVALLEKYLQLSPKLVQGSFYNIKVTTEEDLKYIEKLIEE